MRRLSSVALPNFRVRTSAGTPFTQHSARLRSYSAFTLVELLVVIAIIGILAALLFPVFKASKESANNAKCISNLKQMGAALFSYAADHDGALIPGNTLDDGRKWFEVLNEEYMGGKKRNYSAAPPSWLTCPSQKVPAGYGGVWNEYACVGYGWNHCAWTYTQHLLDGSGSWLPDGGFGETSANLNGGWMSRLSQVSKPSQTLIIGDSRDISSNPQYYQLSALYPPTGGCVDSIWRASRHSGKGNYLMVDGHVEALPPTMDISYFQKIK